MGIIICANHLFKAEGYIFNIRMSLEEEEISREISAFTTAHQELTQSLVFIVDKMEAYFPQVQDYLSSGKYQLNSSTFHELQLYFRQIKHLFDSLPTAMELFLVEHRRNDEEEDLACRSMSLQALIEKYRNQNQLILNNSQMDEGSLIRMQNKCFNTTAISVYSSRVHSDKIASAAEIINLKHFPKISKLSIRNSRITDEGLKNVLMELVNLKDIDLSQCYLLTSEAIQIISGYRFVSIKLNKVPSVKPSSLYQLISNSYNLNYLECESPLLRQAEQSEEFIRSVAKLYGENLSNFKWLHVEFNAVKESSCSSISSPTSPNSLLPIASSTNSCKSSWERSLRSTDSSSVNMFIDCALDCCEDLTKSTVSFLIAKCKKAKRLALRKFISLNDSQVEDLMSQLIHLQHLDLSHCYGLTNKSVFHIANQLSRLEDISLSHLGNLRNEGLSYLVEKMPTLKRINLSHCRNVDNSVLYEIGDKLPLLTSLNLQKCELVTDQGIEYLSQRLIYLQHLVLNFCENVGDRSISLISTRLHSLKVLQLEWCSVTQHSIGHIASGLSSLEVINLGYCTSVDDEAIVKMSKYVMKLKQVKLQNCDKISERAFIELFSSQKMYTLQHLSLKQCKGVTDEALRVLCTTSPSSLKLIDLSWCKALTDSGLFSLSQYQHQLKHLNLSGCSNISDIGVEWICATLSLLQYLNLSLCDNITDTAILQLSKSLHSLRVLYLCDLKSITDSSVSTLSEICSLQQLHLSGCVEITSSSLIALLHNLQKLQTLNISECVRIYPNSLTLLVERMKNLRKLEIASLEIDDFFLQTIGSNMEKLRFINLEYCRQVTGEGVIEMLEKIRGLVRIDIQNTSICERKKQIIFKQLSLRQIYSGLID